MEKDKRETQVMKKFFLIIVILLVLVLLFLAGNEIYLAKTATKISILYTSDIHGHILPEKHFNQETNSTFETGGFGSLDTYIKGLFIPYILLDAGDTFVGTPEGALKNGEAIIEIMNKVGYRGWGIGNHELDRGLGFLENFIKKANFTAIATNLVKKDGSPIKGTLPYAIFNVSGKRVAVVSVIEEDLEKVISPQVSAQLKVLNVGDSVKRAIKELEGRYDVFVVLSGLGMDKDRELADEVQGIDLILGGEYHIPTPRPVFVKNTMIVSPGWALMYVGRVDLWLVDGKIKRKKWKLEKLSKGIYPASHIVENVLLKYATPEYKKMNEVVGSAKDWILRKKGVSPESPLGNLITDIMRRETGADFAFQNQYGIRADIPPGNVKIRDLAMVSPFGNTIVTMKLTGAQIRELLKQSATEEKGILQMSGLKMYFNSSLPEDRRLLNVIVNGREIDPEEEFLVATNSFLAHGGDGFKTFLEGKEIKDTKLKLLDAEIKYFKENSPVSAQIEGRIIDIMKD